MTQDLKSEFVEHFHGHLFMHAVPKFRHGHFLYKFSNLLDWIAEIGTISESCWRTNPFGYIGCIRKLHVLSLSMEIPRVGSQLSGDSESLVAQKPKTLSWHSHCFL